MATWKWYACNLKTGVLIAELPLKPTGAITSLMCQDGAGSFVLPVTDPATPAEWWLCVQPYRTCIVGEVNGVVVWAGWIKGVTQKSDNTSTVEFVCSTIEGYFQERYVDEDLSFNPPDQNAVMAGLVAHTNDNNGLNLGIESPNSGVMLDQAVYYRHADQQIYAMLTEISDTDGGPEWTITSLWDPETTIRTIRHVFYAKTPHLGTVTSRPAHRFTYPGNIKSWSLDTGGPYANVVVAGGAGDGPTRYMSTPGVAHDSNAYAVYGYPLFESRLSTQAGTQAGVDRLALGELAATRKFSTVLSLTVDIGAIDVSNLWGKGDTAYVEIDAPNLKNQYSNIWRITGWDVDSENDTITPHLIEYEP